MRKFDKPVYICKSEFVHWYFDNEYFNHIEITQDSIKIVEISTDSIDLELKLKDGIGYIPIFLILNPEIIPEHLKKDGEITPRNFSDLRFVNAYNHCLDSEGKEYLILDASETMYLNIQSQEIYLIDNSIERGIISLEIPVDAEHSKLLEVAFILTELQISMIRNLS